MSGSHGYRRAGARLSGKVMLGLLSILAGPVAAEDRPFYRCTFDDGRDIVLAQTDSGFEWREGDFVAPLATEPQDQPDPVLSFVSLWDDPERLDVFVGWQLGSGPDLPVGSALLSRTVIDAAGRMESHATPGLCVDALP